MGQRKISIQMNSIYRIIICVALVFGIAMVAFLYFEYSTQSHIALREAKNVKMAIEMLDKEAYAKDECIYDKTQSCGLSKESLDKIKELSNEDSHIVLRQFDMDKRQVKEFVYRNKRYEVTYKFDGVDETYEVKRRQKKD